MASGVREAQLQNLKQLLISHKYHAQKNPKQKDGISCVKNILNFLRISANLLHNLFQLISS